MNQHQISNSSFSWEETVSALIELQNYQIDTQTQPTKQSVSHKEYIHQEKIQIVSLFHSRFEDLFGQELKKEFEHAFSSIDYESPQSYNLGRCSSSSIIFSGNHQFILKTVSACNFHHFKKMFHADYFKLVEDCQSTIIAKIYGFYSLDMIDQLESEQMTKVHFILMENLFYETFGGNILMVFDLKGAQINRHTQDFKNLLKNQQECMQKDMVIPTIKGKDNDFKEIIDNPFMHLDKSHRQQILESIVRETFLMSKSKIMDYSLMLIVAKLGQIKQKNSSWRQIHIKDDLYLTIGMIDYLQEFNQSKALENKVKSFLGMFKKNNEISCVDSEKYRQRFVDYCFTILLVGEHE